MHKSKSKPWQTSDGTFFLDQDAAERHELAHIMGLTDDNHEQVAALLRARAILAPIFKARRKPRTTKSKNKSQPAAP